MTLPSNTPTIDDLIDNAILKMSEFGVETKEYSAAASQLEKLVRAKKTLSESEGVDVETQIKLVKLEKERQPEPEPETAPWWRPSPDVVISAGASILGILAILHYEKASVVTSKAIGFVGKMK